MIASIGARPSGHNAAPVAPGLKKGDAERDAEEPPSLPPPTEAVPFPMD